MLYFTTMGGCEKYSFSANFRASGLLRKNLSQGRATCFLVDVLSIDHRLFTCFGAFCRGTALLQTLMSIPAARSGSRAKQARGVILGLAGGPTCAHFQCLHRFYVVSSGFSHWGGCMSASAPAEQGYRPVRSRFHTGI